MHSVRHALKVIDFDVRPMAHGADVLADAYRQLWRQKVSASCTFGSDLAWEKRLPATVISSPFTLSFRHLRARSAAVHSHLVGLSALGKGEYSPVAANVVVRTLTETALVGKWVLAGEDPTTRIVRVLSVGLDDASQELTLLGAFADPRESSKAFIEQVTSQTQADKAAIQQTLSRLGLESVRRPSATSLFKTDLHSLPAGIGEMMFYSASGIAHGRPTAIEREFDPDPQGFAGLSPSIAMALVAWRLAFAALNAFVETSASYLGWSTDGWDTAFTTTLADVNAADARTRQAVRDELDTRSRQRSRRPRIGKAGRA